MISPIRTPDGMHVPPLRHGDRLTVEEFERRWAAMPELKHAELIEGLVFMNAAALRWDWHAEPHGLVVHVMTSYSFATPGVRFGLEPSIRMEPASMPQPDAVLRVDERSGGRSRLEGGYLVGSPEFLMEISGSSEKHDLREKKALYLRAGVQEYLNWSVLDERILLFALSGSEYLEVSPGNDGILKSSTLPGLWFDPVGLVRADHERISGVLQGGLQSPEHQAFVKELERRRAGSEGKS